MQQALSDILRNVLICSCGEHKEISVLTGNVGAVVYRVQSSLKFVWLNCIRAYDYRSIATSLPERLTPSALLQQVRVYYFKFLVQL